MIFAEAIARQARSPSGPLGRVVAWFMRRETAPENDVAIELLAPPPGGRILEVGCGHDQTLLRLSRLAPSGMLVGLDGSATMLGIARRRNAAAVRSGRVRLLHADSSRIPFLDATFDRVLAVHVLYFWEDPGAHLREIRRVLRAGGLLVLCFPPKSEAISAARFPPSVYAFREVREVERHLRDAGFDGVEIQERLIGSRRLAWAVAIAENGASLPGRRLAEEGAR